MAGRIGMVRGIHIDPPTAPGISASVSTVITVSLDAPSTSRNGPISFYTLFVAQVTGGIVGAYNAIGVTTFPYSHGGSPGATYQFIATATDSAGYTSLNSLPTAQVTNSTIDTGTVWPGQFNAFRGGGLSLVAHDFIATNGYLTVTGTDTATGFVQPPTTAPWGGTPWAPGGTQTQGMIQCIDGVNASTAQTTQIITNEVGPFGVIEPFFRLNNVSAYNNFGGGTQRDYFAAAPDTTVAQGMWYQDMWLQMPLNALTYLGGGKSFVIAETKTSGHDCRVQLAINSFNYGGIPAWQINWDYFPTTYSPWKVFYMSPDLAHADALHPYVPIPTPGSWFRVEFAYRQTSAGNGWTWFALNGTQVRVTGAVAAPGAIGSVSAGGNTPDLQASCPLAERIYHIFGFMLYTDGIDVSAGGTIAQQRNFPYNIARYRCGTSWPPDASSHPANYV